MVKSNRRTAFKSYRDVSDLRTQYQCEYRHHLRTTQGDQASTYSLEGTRLHNDVSLELGRNRSISSFATIVIIVVIITAAFLWILG